METRRLDRATVSLRYGAPSLVTSARGELQALANFADTRLAALRELTADAQRNKDLPGALAYFGVVGLLMILRGRSRRSASAPTV